MGAEASLLVAGGDKRRPCCFEVQTRDGTTPRLVSLSTGLLSPLAKNLKPHKTQCTMAHPPPSCGAPSSCQILSSSASAPAAPPTRRINPEPNEARVLEKTRRDSCFQKRAAPRRLLSPWASTTGSLARGLRSVWRVNEHIYLPMKGDLNTPKKAQ